MFEYNGHCLKVVGFIKIEYLDENKIIFKYKKNKLLIFGKGLKALNLEDKCMDIKGIINSLNIDYLGEDND